MSAPRGMALINALIVVAAISAVAVALLARGDRARERLAAQGTADQARLHLAAATPRAIAQLADSTDPDTPVHHEQDWAGAFDGAAHGRAVLDWELADLQGRFNVNWLSEPDEWGSAPRGALIRLAMAQDVPEERATHLADALTPGGDRAALWEGNAPPDGPLFDPGELREVAGLEDSDIDALAPHLAALPPTAQLNPNTAAPEILGAFLRLDAETAAEAIAPREGDPFTGSADFSARVLEPLGSTALEAFPPGLIDTGSDWFELRARVRLDNARHGRRVVLHRTAPDGAFRVLLSLPEAE